MSSKQNKKQVIPQVGKQAVFQAQGEIGKSAIGRFAQTIGDNNPLYWDERYARDSSYGGVIAPPTLIFELGYDCGDEIDKETGLQQGLGKWLGYPRDLQRAENTYEILQVAHPDDIITAKREVVDVTEREGKRGKWVFITSLISYANHRGELLGTNKETVACRF